MPDTLTPAKSLTKQTVGANSNTWGGILNDSLDLIDAGLGQTLTLAITGNVTLSATQAQKIGYKFTGTPGADKTVTWPTFYGPLVVRNEIETFTLTCGMVSGNTAKVPAGKTAFIFSDGTDFWQLGAATSTTSTPIDPIGTTSTVGLMMGLSGSITPSSSGKVLVIISGDMKNSAQFDGCSVKIRMGTGTAPANGAALTGTAYGSSVRGRCASSDQLLPFSVQTIVSGLTLGTAYWIDLALASLISSFASVADISISAVEI